MALPPPPNTTLEFTYAWRQWLYEVFKELNDMATQDYALEVSKGNIVGTTKVNKFGRATDIDSGVNGDVWDRANASDAQDIWIAPTQARIHVIESTSANDAIGGTGARTVQLYGLTDWDTAETSELIDLAGTTPVNTISSYVIIHRIKVIAKGDATPNIGVITATAATDGTVTAQINAGEGQTQMAIYGIPSTQAAYMEAYYASAIKASASLSVEMTLLVNQEPEVELASYLVKHTIGLATEGTNYMRHEFSTPFRVVGPAIIKLEANATANNTDVSAGFDMYLVNN